MSYITYDELIDSEDSIDKLFRDYLQHAILIHKKVWKLIFKNQRTEQDYEIMEALEKEAAEFQRNLVDDCIWTISKNQPMANHLRYIIALLYSAKDIERICDNGFEIIKTSKYIKDFDFKDFKPLVKLYIDFMIWLETIVADKYNDISVKLKHEKSKFEERFYTHVTKISHDLKHQEMPSKTFYQCSFISKNIDRSVNHFLTIFKNFKYIRYNGSKTKKVKL